MKPPIKKKLEASSHTKMKPNIDWRVYKENCDVQSVNGHTDRKVKTEVGLPKIMYI